MNVKKKNALFGRYPSCDLLNNALRFLREGNTDEAVEEIIFAIEKAGGYFHEDNVKMVTNVKKHREEIIHNIRNFNSSYNGGDTA